MNKIFPFYEPEWYSPDGTKEWEDLGSSVGMSKLIPEFVEMGRAMGFEIRDYAGHLWRRPNKKPPAE